MILNEVTCKVFKSKIIDEIFLDIKENFYTDLRNFLFVKTGKGWISIDEIQVENKKRMNIGDFLRGNIIRSVL